MRAIISSKLLPRFAFAGYRPLGVAALAVVMLTWLSATDACAQDSPDEKLWLAQKVSLERDQWTYIGEVHQRFYDDMSQWEELYANVGIAYGFSKSWSASVFFRLRSDRFNSDDEQIERRPYVNIEYKTSPFGNIDLGLRTRYEYRDFQGADTKHRLKERIRLSYPLNGTPGSKPIKAYVSDEICFPLDTHKVSLHEIQVGLEIPTQSPISYQVFWGHEVKRRGDSLDYHTNIVGVEIGWKF